jgi:hypothetical protein
MTQSYLTLSRDDVTLLQALLVAETKGFVRAIVDRDGPSKKKTDDIMALVSGHAQYEAIIEQALHGVHIEGEQLDFLRCLVEYGETRTLPNDLRATYKTSRDALIATLDATHARVMFRLDGAQALALA